MSSRSEASRLAAVHASGVLLERPQEALNAVARAAAALCGVPVGMINVIDEETLTTTAAAGLADLGPGARTPRSQTVCQYAIEVPDELTVIDDLTRDPRPGCAGAAQAGLRFYAGANLLSSAQASLGVLCVVGQHSQVLSDVQRAGLRDLAAVAAALIEQHGLARQLITVSDRLGREASTDPLTGLHNRRALEPVLANLPLRTGIAMVDLDHFKSLNDRCGHEAGDNALRGYADLFLDSLRGGDIAARWGGEEFLLVLADAREPRTVLERIRRRVHDTRQPVTFSAGLTVARPGEDPRELVARADRLLYRAKESGRDRVADDLG